MCIYLKKFTKFDLLEKTIIILRNIVSTSVGLDEKGKEVFYLRINKENLEYLTNVIYIKNNNFPFSEYLSLILLILSFKKENL